MTVTGTYTTVSAIGIREDLEDMIYRIDPTETPFMSSIGKTKVSNKYHEWQTQNLATASGTNRALDGADAAAATALPTARLGNRTQISTKTVAVSGGLDAVDTAGRAKELNYQVLLKGLELKRDMETSLTGKNPSVADDGTNAGTSAGIESFLVTNVSRGASGANGGFASGVVAAPNDGTQRAFTETILKAVMVSCFQNGAKPTMLLLGAAQKQVFSGFTGIAVNRVDLKSPHMATIIGAADVYVSDFGQLAIVPDIFSRNRSALFITPKYAKVGYLRSMRDWPLAKTGDADKRQMLVEYTLVVGTEAAHGIAADLT